ncbi:hypothetical protein A9Q85_00470, partial [Cycloclasticus sp. 44_32_T64]
MFSIKLNKDNMSLSVTKALSLEFALPSQPELLLALQNEIRKSDANIVKIGEIISEDVAISAAVLKTINSSFFGMRVEISSIQHAVSLMGVAATTNIVTGYALEHSVRSNAISLPRYWDTAKNTANLCAYVANRLKLHEPSEPYMLGLFHDIGIPLMASRFPDYLEVLRDANAQEDGRITEVEDAAYSTNHAVMGYYLCREWGLSESIRQVISLHHDCASILSPSSSLDDDTAILMAILKL